MTVNVTPVNDAPTQITPTSQITAEDTAKIFSIANANAITIADIDSASVTTFLSVSKGSLTLASTAGLSVSGNNTATLTITGSIANINNALNGLKYTPTADYNGSDQLNISTSDGTLSTSNTVAINITPVADIVADTITTNEDTAIAFNVLTGTNGASADNFENTGRLVTSVTQGTNGSVSFTAAGALIYTPHANFNGTDVFTYTVTNGGTTETTTVTMNVRSINDAPSGTNKTLTINEDSSYTFSSSDFGFSDVDGNTFLAVKITLPAGFQGTLKNNGTLVTNGQYISIADILANKLVFSPATNANGNNYGNFTFQVQDNGLTANGGIDLDQSPNTMTINVIPVNDAPTQIVPSAQTTTEDTLKLFGSATGNAITIADVDNTSVTTNLNVAHGTLTLSTTTGLSVTGNSTSTITLTGSVTSINAALNGLKYIPTADYNGSDQLNISTNDGAMTTSNTVSINITPVADIVADTITINEDTAIAFNVLTGTNGASADNFENAGRSVTSVTQGANGSVSFTAAGALTYTPNANFNGTDTFTYTVTSGGVTETATVTMNVRSVNDAPSGANASISVVNNAVYTFSTADFGFTDVDGNSLAAVKITTVPQFANIGTLKNNGVTVTAGQFISVADIVAGKLVYISNASSNSTNSFTFQVQDNGTTLNGGINLDQSPNTITLQSILTLNHAPSGTDATVTLNEDSTYTFSTANISSQDHHCS